MSTFGDVLFAKEITYKQTKQFPAKASLKLSELNV